MSYKSFLPRLYPLYLFCTLFAWGVGLGFCSGSMIQAPAYAADTFGSSTATANEGYESRESRIAQLIQVNEGEFQQVISLERRRESSSNLPGAQFRKTVLFIFASWCPYCKEKIHAMAALAKKYPDFDYFFLSVDKSLEQLQMSNFMKLTDKIYIIDRSQIPELSKRLQIPYNPYVPATFLFDENMKFISDEPIDWKNAEFIK